MEPPALGRRHIRMFNLAKKIARSSTAPNFKVSAILCKGNKVLGVGFNNVYKSHPLVKDTKSGKIHAELAAILNAKSENLRRSSVYLWRHGREEKPLLITPCEHCRTLLINAGIHTIYYAVGHNLDGSVKFESEKLWNSQ